MVARFIFRYRGVQLLIVAPEERENDPVFEVINATLRSLRLKVIDFGDVTQNRLQIEDLQGAQDDTTPVFVSSLAPASSVSNRVLTLTRRKWTELRLSGEKGKYFTKVGLDGVEVKEFIGIAGDEFLEPKKKRPRKEGEVVGADGAGATGEPKQRKKRGRKSDRDVEGPKVKPDPERGLGQ